MSSPHGSTLYSVLSSTGRMLEVLGRSAGLADIFFGTIFYSPSRADSGVGLKRERDYRCPQFERCVPSGRNALANHHADLSVNECWRSTIECGDEERLERVFVAAGVSACRVFRGAKIGRHGGLPLR